MKKFEVRAYHVYGDLKEALPPDLFGYAYTINHYTSGRVWSDSIFSVTFSLNIKKDFYISTMKEKFNCTEYNGRLFFKTMKECQEAISFLDSLVIMNKLL